MIYHIYDAYIVTDLDVFRGDIIVRNQRIEDISEGEKLPACEGEIAVDGSGCYVIPGAIDTHVHFREPGLTHKADFFTESKAAVAGGVTSIVDMPNTLPVADSLTEIHNKIRIAAEKSFCNYHFQIAATDSNVEHLLSLSPHDVFAIKMFLGASTGHITISNHQAIERIFKHSKHIICLHCEDDEIITKNFNAYKTLMGDKIPIQYHSRIRSSESCVLSTSKALKLALRLNTNIHILHVSTATEIELLRKAKEASTNISFEICPHYLFFNESDYEHYGARLKCNPSIKTFQDQQALLRAVSEDIVDTIGTDHAPHLLEEKISEVYEQIPSGLPGVQFLLYNLLELVYQKRISLQRVVELVSHRPALRFGIKHRGFIRKGYFADLVLIQDEHPWVLKKHDILSRCGWSPYEGKKYHWKIVNTFVNGQLVWDGAIRDEKPGGMLLEFER